MYATFIRHELLLSEPQTTFFSAVSAMIELALQAGS